MVVLLGAGLGSGLPDDCKLKLGFGLWGSVVSGFGAVEFDTAEAVVVLGFVTLPFEIGVGFCIEPFDVVGGFVFGTAFGSVVFGVTPVDSVVGVMVLGVKVFGIVFFGTVVPVVVVVVFSDRAFGVAAFVEVFGWVLGVAIFVDFGVVFGILFVTFGVVVGVVFGVIGVVVVGVVVFGIVGVVVFGIVGVVVFGIVGVFGVGVVVLKGVAWALFVEVAGNLLVLFCLSGTNLLLLMLEVDSDFIFLIEGSAKMLSVGIFGTVFFVVSGPISANLRFCIPLAPLSLRVVPFFSSDSISPNTERFCLPLASTGAR
jgi:hypothetical protein